MKHVKLALELLEMAINQNPPPVKESEKAQRRTVLTTMIIAYYNYGAELEYLQDFQNSLKAFCRGFDIAMKEFGSDHPLTSTLEQNIRSLNQKKKVYNRVLIE